jgi:hypothetical protein
MVLKYPRIKAENIVFRENFINDDYVEDNGISLVATPTINNGLVLNGTTQYVTAEPISFIEAGEDIPFSISTWVNFTDASQSTIISKGRYGSTLEYILYTGSSDKLLFAIYDEDADGAGSTGFLQVSYDSAITAYEGQKVHVVATYDGSAAVAGMKIFLNGVQVNDASSASVGADTYNKMRQSSDLIQIGADEGALLFDGTIYNITLHKRVLSAEEILDTYQQDTFTEVDASKAVVCLPLRSTFDDGSNIVTENLGTAGVIYWGNGSGAGEPTLLENNGIDFSSGNVYLKKPVPISLTSLSETITVGCLVKMNSTSSTQCFIENEDNWMVSYLNGYGIGLQFFDSEGAYHSYKFGGIPPVGVWTYITVVYDGSSALAGIKLYINGIEQTATLTSWDGTISDGSSSLAIGIRATSYSSQALDGAMKSPFVIKQALTPTQIKWLSEKAFRGLNK